MYTYKLGGMLITDELYHDDLEAVTFGRKDQNELMHYGIKGQSWGKRRFQNEDGSLTMAGRNRYDVGDPLKGTSAYAAIGGGNKPKSFGGASGGGGSVTPKGSPTISVYGSGITNGGKSYSHESHSGPGQSAGRTITNKVKAKVNGMVDSGRKAADSLFSSVGNALKPATDAIGKAAEFVTGANANRRVEDAQKAYDEASRDMMIDNRSYVIGTKGANAEHDAENWQQLADQERAMAKAYDTSANNRGLFDFDGKRADQYQRDQHEAQAREYANKAHELRIQVPKEYEADYRRFEEADRNLRAAEKARDENTLGGVVGNAAKDAGNWLGNAFNDAKNWVGNTAQDVGKAATSAYNDISKAAGDAVNWVGDRARDVGDGANNATKDVGQAAQNVGNWAGNAAKDVGNFASNAYNDVSSWFSDGSKERVKLGKTRHDDEILGAISRDFVKKNYPDEYGQFVKDQDSAKQARAQAVDDYMNFSNNPVNTVSRALNLPNKKGNWAYAVPGNEQYLDKFDEKWIPKTENIADWFTGNNYSNARNTRNRYANDWDAKADKIKSYNDPDLDSFAEDANRYASEQREYADALDNMYNNAPRQKINSALGAAGDWVGDRAKDVGNFATNAVNDVGRTVGNAARDVGNWVGNAANDVGKTVSGAANDVGDWASNAASDVRDWGAGALDKGRQAFESLFGRSEPTVNEKLDPTPKTFTENIIEEQRIPENREIETRTIEDNFKPIETKPIETKPTVSGSNNVQTWDNGNINTWDNVKTFGDSDMVNDNGFLNRGSSSNSGNSSSMSDKPSNVSDEYWNTYTSNGGTRESYDQRMREKLMSDKPSNVSEDFWERWRSNGGTREGFDRTFKQGIKEGLYKEDEYFEEPYEKRR